MAGAFERKIRSRSKVGEKSKKLTPRKKSIPNVRARFDSNSLLITEPQHKMCERELLPYSNRGAQLC